MPLMPLPAHDVNVIVLRRNVVGEDVEKNLHSTAADAEKLNLPDGEFAIYEAKGKLSEDGFPPRFELVKRLKVKPPKPVEPKVSEVETLG